MSASSHPDFDLALACVGILASEPLRSIGLQAILEDGLKLRTVILPGGARPRSCKPNLVIIDEGQAWSADPLSQVYLRSPAVAVVVLTRGEYAGAAEKALAAGARAALPETAEIVEIRACIRAVLRGKTWMPKSAGTAGKQKPASVATGLSLDNRLTPKEREVMQWLTQGRSNREIARTMGIDEATVKAHLGRMLRKAEASNRVELTLRVIAERKLIA